MPMFQTSQRTGKGLSNGRKTTNVRGKNNDLRHERREMISKNRIKYIKSLQMKKFRMQEQIFVAEGPKVVHDLMAVYRPRTIVATDAWLNRQAGLADLDIVCVSEAELKHISFLQHPQSVMALFPIPQPSLAPHSISTELSLALDGIRDPGNLGTIIRLADWFGIRSVYCSEDTTDAFNPKVVQATMGSIAHVSIIRTDLKQLIEGLPADTPVYGTLLDGDNLYTQPLENRGLLIMGNEGNGISPAISRLITQKLFVPPYPVNRQYAESLNVATATAIVCSEIRRRSVAAKPAQ